MHIFAQKPPSSEPVEAASPLAIGAPAAEDGAAVHDLIAACPPLDPNSLYCNLLQCNHFAATCCIARQDGRAVGWVSAYRPPSAPGELFVWQVAVHPNMRGRNLAARMILDILSRTACDGVAWISASVTEDNRPSRRMFEALAEALDTSIRFTPLFDRTRHFAGRHASEHRLAIGPIAPRAPETKQ